MCTPLGRLNAKHMTESRMNGQHMPAPCRATWQLRHVRQIKHVGFCTLVGDGLYFWSPEAAAKRPKLAQAGIEARRDLAFGQVYKIDLPAPERSCRSYPCLAASCSPYFCYGFCLASGLRHRAA